MAQISASLVKELREISGAAMMDCKRALVESDGDIEKAKEYLRKKGQAKAIKKSSRETNDGAVGLFISEDQKKGSLVKLACETDFVAKNEGFQELLNSLVAHIADNGNENLLNQSLNGKTIQELITEKVSKLGENIQLLDSKQIVTDKGIIGGYLHMTGKIGVLVKLETDSDSNAEKLKELAKDISMHIAATQAEAIDPDSIDSSVLEKEKEIFIAQAKESGKPDNIIEKMVQGRIKKYLKEVCILTQPFVKAPDKTVGDLLKEFSKEIGVAITLKEFVKYQF